MNNIITIATKEFRGFFHSPVAYIVLTVFLLTTGWLFFSSFFLIGEASLRNFFALMPLMLVIFSPAVTMRLLAEERKSGTFELIATMPLKDRDIILGKYLSACALLICGLFFTVPYALSVATIGVIDFGPVLSGYVGTLALILALAAIGILASALAKNQISALILALALGFTLYLVGAFTFFLPESLGSFLAYISLTTHFENFTRGIIDTKDIIYYLSIAFLALYLGVLTLKARRNN